MIGAMTSSDAPATFAAIGLRAELVAAVVALGYEEPTPVQRETIPLLLKGRDLLVQAETRAGKTPAFALPLLPRISEGPRAPPPTSRPLPVPPPAPALHAA